MKKHYPLDPATGIENPSLAWANGNPATGQDGAYPPFGLFVDPQAEILNAQRASGLTDSTDGSDTAQVSQAISRGTWLGVLGQPATVNDLAGALPGSVTWPLLLIGMEFSGLINAANTGPMTVMLTGFGTLPGKLNLVGKNGGPLVAGDVAASTPFKFKFDGTAFRMSGPVASDLGKSFNTFYLARPAQQQLFVDPVNGSESNDGSTSLLARKDIDAVLDQQQNVGTAIVLLNDALIRRRRNFYGALSMYGGVASGNGGWNATNRKISFLAVADNSPLADGTSFCAGFWILGSASFTTNYLYFSLPVQPAGLTFADHIRSDNGAAVLIRGSSLLVDGAGAGSLLGNNGGIPLRAILTIGLGANAAGHLFLGIAAGGNPNTNPLQYQSNVTSG